MYASDEIRDICRAINCVVHSLCLLYLNLEWEYNALKYMYMLHEPYIFKFCQYAIFLRCYTQLSNTKQPVF